MSNETLEEINENSEKISMKVKEALPTQVGEVERVSEAKIQITLLIVRRGALYYWIVLTKGKTLINMAGWLYVVFLGKEWTDDFVEKHRKN